MNKPQELMCCKTPTKKRSKQEKQNLLVLYSQCLLLYLVRLNGLLGLERQYKYKYIYDRNM